MLALLSKPVALGSMAEMALGPGSQEIKKYIKSRKTEVYKTWAQDMGLLGFKS